MEETLKRKTSDILRILRKEKGITQGQLADEIDVTKDTIASWEADYAAIGKNACIESLGKAFVESHKADACFGTQEMDDRLFCFLGIDLHPDNRKLCLSNENDWDVYSSCFVSDGIVEMGSCKLPL